MLVLLNKYRIFAAYYNNTHNNNKLNISQQ